MTDFGDVLLEEVGPPLGEVGFRYEPRPEDRALAYSFVRRTDGDVVTEIRFDRHAKDGRPVGSDFRVWLRRWRQRDPEWDGYIDLPLRTAVRDGLRVDRYPANEQWWSGRGEDELRAS